MIKPKRSKQCQNWGKEKSEKMHEKLAEKIDRQKPQERIRVWRKSECIQN